jgi:hypothetical protein
MPQTLETMHGIEEVLSLDLEKNDFLYRIQRESRIVYVSVLHDDIIPVGERTDSLRILSKLKGVPKWDENWTTLTIRRSSDSVIQSTVDEFPPHSLDTKALDVQDPIYFNILDLKPSSRISDRISRVVLDDKTMILKIARFQYEIPALQQEVLIYALLASRGFAFAPKVLGYAYEELRDRTIGFLMEDISGRTPGAEDLKFCEGTIRLLHKSGILHGDVNRYNFLMADCGAIVFDFEVATIKEVVASKESDDEIETLVEKLKDNSGVGKR